MIHYSESALISLVVLTLVPLSGVAQQVISPSLMKIDYVDSQETAQQNGKATNAFDGKPSTIWHTEWSNTKPGFPHEIRVDLGSTYQLTEFRHLPRQDGWTYGQILKYELHVSTDGRQWSRVVAGQFPRTKSQTRVPLSRPSARYVKLIALSEINGARYASASEFGFTGHPVNTGFLPTAAPTTSPAQTGGLKAADDDRINWSDLLASARGATYFVSSEAQFNATSAVARPGDVVVIRNGSYSGWKLKIPSVGTAQQPIIYTAQTPGGVILSGIHQHGLLITGAFNIIGGLRFERCGSYFIRFLGARNNRFTDSTVASCGDSSVARVVELIDGSNNNRIDHTIFEKNKAISLAVTLPRPGIDPFSPSLDNRIDHNIFRDISRADDRGMRPPLQIGQWLGEQKLWPRSSTVVEYNEFRNIDGQAVNSKSDGEVYRYNRFYKVTWDGLSLRGGDDKIIEGNYFENVKIPIIAYGDGHKIINNIMVNQEIGILLPKWGEYQIQASKTSFSPPTGNMLVAHNTVINSSFAAVELGRTWGYTQNRGWLLATNLPYNMQFANNIFVSSKGTLFRYIDGKNIVVSRNVYRAIGEAQNGKIGLEAIEADPGLSSSYRPVAGSIAINAATAVSAVRVDAAGQARTSGGGADIGAYEYVP